MTSGLPDHALKALAERTSQTETPNVQRIHGASLARLLLLQFPVNREPSEPLTVLTASSVTHSERWKSGHWGIDRGTDGAAVLSRVSSAGTPARSHVSRARALPALRQPGMDHPGGSNDTICPHQPRRALFE